MKFSLSFVVDAADIDEQGHVNNVAFVRWIQDVAVAHWRQGATDEMIENFSWVVRHEIDYKRLGFQGDEIHVLTWVGVWTHATCERVTEISRGEELLAKGRTV
jgi:acyl-CoA thioester hydrolase